MSTIKPTVGRIVYFYESKPGIGSGHSNAGFTTTGPHAAVVTQVHSDNCVNLAVFNQNGNSTFGRTSIKLLAPGETRPFHANSNTEQWVEWMPHQIATSNGQANLQRGADAAERVRQASTMGNIKAEPATRPLDQVPVGIAQSSQMADCVNEAESDESHLRRVLRAALDELDKGRIPGAVVENMLKRYPMQR